MPRWQDFLMNKLMCKVFSHASVRSYLFSLVFLVVSSMAVYGQRPLAAGPGDSTFRTVIAGKQYAKSNFYQWKWGRHYRKEWTTPVRVHILNMDSAGGGLTPVRRGGGNQSRTLHLEGANGKDYVFRSIDKYYGQALPDLYKGTFVERILGDQASTAHPYAAFTIPTMINAAGIYHTKPVLVIIPDHPRLDSFRAEFGNMLVLFEERANNNQSTEAHFGNSLDVMSTEQMMERITKDHDHRVDQLAYVKARIFDMFIGDWGRHEDQWRWASFKVGDKTIYKPIPRDRDQTYTKFDGAFLKRALGAAKLKHLKTFDHSIKDITTFNFPARHLDRRLANEPTREQWLAMAAEIQAAMTDEVIRNSIRQMPGEVFQASGEEIISKLISRRNDLKAYAENYYHFLAQEVEIVGSEKPDHFRIEHLSSGETRVTTSGSSENRPSSRALYSRTFSPLETKEIRLYGLSDTDAFQVTGNKGSIRLRLIGGAGNDLIGNTSADTKIHVYDTEAPGEDIKGGGNNSDGLKLHVTSKDTLKTEYKYDRFVYNKKGIRFKPGTTVGIGYYVQKQKFGKQPYGYEQSLMFEWTFTRGGYALVYRGQFNEVFGRWGLAPVLRYDFPYVDHFFGIGNNTTRQIDKKNSFYRVRTKELLAGLGINRRVDSHFIQLQPFYQSVEVDLQEGKFLSLSGGGVPQSAFGKKSFGGVDLMYRYQQRNDPLTPTKGIGFTASTNYTKNFTDTNMQIMRYSAALWGYIPLFRNTTFAVRIGGATVDGDPLFYQLNTLGGNINFRGYPRRRFFGTTSGYNNNEIRWLPNTRNRLFNGQIGLLAFFDQARIWQKGERSEKWHYGYGGGLVIVPFKRAVLNGTIGFGDEKSVIHARIGFLF